MSSKTTAKVYDLDGQTVESLELPKVFETPVREDLIGRVYVALDTHRRHPQGRDPLAGERTSAETNNPPTGRGISRIPRVKGERYAKGGLAGGVASTVGGRLPFPPRSEKVIRKEINRKERQLALASAIAATGDKELVLKRGHDFSSDLPIVVSDDIEKVAKIRDLKKFISAIGVDRELVRVTTRKRKLTSRVGRLRRTGVGPLFVVSDSSTLRGSLKSVPGVSVAKISDLSILDLAPGSFPGRLTIWSKSSFKNMPKQLVTIGEKYAT